MRKPHHFPSDLLLVFLWLAGTFSLMATEDTPIMELSEIKTGMRGEWHTVTSGTTIQKFPIEVLGVASNFSGPQQSVIICQALDPENHLSGPVGGMSGSPVYFDGKLAGAYAYGFLWPKEQAIIGVTPIRQMLALVEEYPLSPIDRSRPQPPFSLPAPSPEKFSRTDPPSPLAEPAAGVSHQELWQPLPTPLMAAGFSTHTLEKFADHFRQRGIEPMQAPMGGPTDAPDLPLTPGSAVAGILMTGDFQVAATGTITYRHDDRILAFGHPFFKMGPAEIPLAGAEVITIVRSVQRSFKLAKPGPIVGSIFQDRLSGIAGVIGQPPPMTDYRVRIVNEREEDRVFQSQLFEHPQLSPLLSAVALFQSLSSTMESTEEQTIQVDGTIAMEGHAPIQFRNLATGPDGGFRLALQLLRELDQLYANPYGLPRFSSMDFTVHLTKGIRAAMLKQVLVETSVFKAGQPVEASVSFDRYQEPSLTRRVSLTIPAHLPVGTPLTLFFGTAAEADRVDGLPEQIAASVDDLAKRWSARRSPNSLYVKLLAETEGLQVEGASLPNLPPSISQQLTSPGTAFVRHQMKETTLAEISIPLEGEVFGNYRVQFFLD